MQQKNLVTSTMAGHDHHNVPSIINKSPFPTSDPSSYDQSNMAGINVAGPFTNQMFNKIPQEISELFYPTSAAAGSAINDIGMFSQICIGSEQNPGLMMKNNVERENNNISSSTSSSLMMQGGDNVREENQMGPNNMARIHDFLGVGGGGLDNFHEADHQHQQQRLELDVMNNNHQRVSSSSSLINHHHFQHQHHNLSRGDSPLDKTIWDV